MNTDSSTIRDWQVLVNKPAFASDGKEVGVVISIQPKDIIVSSGPVTPDKYHIPKGSVKSFTNGVLYLADTSEFIEKNYKFE